MVTPEIEDYKSSPQWQEFLKTIADIKKIAEEHREKIGIFQNIMPNLEVRPFTGALMYSLHFGLYQNYDIFVCTGVPNKDTPPIMVQIRSNALWVEGMKNIFDRAYDCVERVLDSFGIKIEKIQENRIDYAFHTNYINNAMTFFPEKDLGKMFVGNFERGRKDYNFHTHEDDEQGNGDRIVESDYFTLGRHKSNNVFFRAYNKTKEVIEMGEKQFFIPIWLKYGLINKFDEYVLKKTFIDGRYESVDRARCEFYYDYGSDNQIKREIGEKLLDKGTPAKWYTKKAKGLVPGLTIVSNIEIQTKRKFYDRKRLQNVTTEESPKKRIYNIFDQMSELIRFITDDTIRFVSYKGKYAKTPRIKRPMSDWWKRLRRAKKVEITEEWEIEYLHIYQHNLDFERQKQLMLKKQAKTAAYVDYSQGKIFDNMDVEINPKYCMVLDFQNFFEYLNDNDFKKYYINKSDGFKEIMQKNHQNNVAEKKLEKRESPKYRQKQLKLVDENDIQYEKDLNALYSVKGLSPQEYRQKQIDLYLEYCKNKKNVQ
jgi:hypothetical protein